MGPENDVSASSAGERFGSREPVSGPLSGDLSARVQSIEEGLQHLKDCVQEALRLCASVDGAPVEPWVVLDEEWSN